MMANWWREQRRGRSLLGVSLAAGFQVGVPAAMAEDPAPDGFRIMLQSGWDVGAGVMVGESRFVGMYTGLEDGDVVALFDPTLIARDDETGTWLRLEGRQLGLDSRDLRFEVERQGDWSLSLDLGQTPKSNPNEIVTGLSGIGGPVQRVAGEPRRRVDFETGRDRVDIAFRKLFNRNIEAKTSYRYEKKRGERQWGAQGFNFLAEPIDQTSRELTGSVGYTSKRLQLSAGYLGSFFDNANKVLDNNSAQTQIALPADNQAHRIWLDAGLLLAPTTRASIKASYEIALQEDAFFTAPTLAGNNRTDLGGRVDNMLVHLGLTARPMRDLGLNVKLRHDERDDRTVRTQYITATATRSGFNTPLSRTTTSGDVEANYRLPTGLRLIAGLRQEHWSRTRLDLQQSSFRDNTDETTARMTLKRAATGSFGGSIGYSFADRSGSNFVAGRDSRIDPINLGDRERHKVKATLDWAPDGPVSAQLRVEYATDTYDSKPLGPRDGETRLAALDLSYALSKTWTISAWGSLSDVRLDQATNGDGTDVNGAAVTDQDWAAELRHLSRAVGVAVRGQLADGLTTGVDARHARDRSEHEINSLGTQDLPSLPDIRYEQTSIGFFLDYALSRMSRIRLNYGFEHVSADDWTWRGFSYADGTTVRIPGTENSHFVGLAWSYRM